MSEPTPRADRLFQTAHDGDAYALAQKIERREDVSLDDVAPFVDVINRRYGEDITLLFHALSSANFSAVDALLAAGADTRQPDKATGSTRDFIFYLASPGGPLIDADGLTELIGLYLKHGGDPNVRMLGESQRPLVDALATYGLNDGFMALLQSGADPWARELENGQPTGSNAMMGLAASGKDFDTLNTLIDGGYFDTVAQRDLTDFLVALGGYAQRGDERSLAIKNVAMRVLKRNPNYAPPKTAAAAPPASSRTTITIPSPALFRGTRSCRMTCNDNVIGRRISQVGYLLA